MMNEFMWMSRISSHVKDCYASKFVTKFVIYAFKLASTFWKKLNLQSQLYFPHESIEGGQTYYHPKFWWSKVLEYGV